MPSESFWTPEKAKALDATFALPHMQDFLLELKDRIRVKGNVGGLPPGYDALVLGFGQFNHSSGQSSVLDIIEDMRTEKKPVKPINQDEMFIAPENRKKE